VSVFWYGANARFLPRGFFLGGYGVQGELGRPKAPGWPSQPQVLMAGPRILNKGPPPYMLTPRDKPSTWVSLKALPSVPPIGQNGKRRGYREYQTCWPSTTALFGPRLRSRLNPEQTKTFTQGNPWAIGGRGFSPPLFVYSMARAISHFPHGLHGLASGRPLLLGVGKTLSPTRRRIGPKDFTHTRSFGGLGLSPRLHCPGARST